MYFHRYYDKRDAEDAMDAMDGAIFDGRELRVQEARHPRPSSFGGRSGGRYGGGGGYGGRRGRYGASCIDCIKLSFLGKFGR